MVTERMGLRVDRNTLRADWGDDGLLYHIFGSVEIEKTEACILRDDTLLQIASLLAAEVAYDKLEQTIRINSWRVERIGDSIQCTPTQFEADEPEPAPKPMSAHLKHRLGIPGGLAYVILLIPNLLLWA